MRIDTGDTSYSPNSIDGHFPVSTTVEAGGFATAPERVDGVMRRIRSDSFNDYFTQAKMFWNSMSPIEKEHITTAFSFELAKVNRPEIRERVLGQMLANIDMELATAVAANLGLPPPVANTADSPAAKTNGKLRKRVRPLDASPLLSQLNPATGVCGDITGRKVAIIVADGSLASDVTSMQTALAKAGAEGLVIGARLGTVDGEDGEIVVDHTSLTMPSVVFDAIYVPGGEAAVATLAGSGLTLNTIAEAYKHLKAIAFGADADVLAAKAGIDISDPVVDGVFIGDAKSIANDFIAAIGQHRVWTRRNLEAVPV
jgi:catalase